MLARIFVLYLFLGADGYPQAALLENCLLLRTDNDRGQISKHIFTPKLMKVIVYLYQVLQI